MWFFLVLFQLSILYFLIKSFVVNNELHKQNELLKHNNSVQVVVIDEKNDFIKNLEKEYSEFKQTQSKRPESYDVLELMHDLTNGRAIIEIKRIAPSDFFLKRPSNE